MHLGANGQKLLRFLLKQCIVPRKVVNSQNSYMKGSSANISKNSSSKFNGSYRRSLIDTSEQFQGFDTGNRFNPLKALGDGYQEP